MGVLQCAYTQIHIHTHAYIQTNIGVVMIGHCGMDLPTTRGQGLKTL